MCDPSYGRSHTERLEVRQKRSKHGLRMDGRYECHSRDGRFENATLFRKVSFRVKTRLLRTEGGSTLVPPDFSDSYGNYRQAFIEYLWAWLQIAGRNSARILIVEIQYGTGTGGIGKSGRKEIIFGDLWWNYGH